MEDYKYKLSFIIPLFNAEKYICDCLDSILNSDLPYDAYEIVVIDDGSKDNGPAIVKQYQQKCNQIIMLSQPNQGQSVARNYGIKECHGEYIWCVDSDDKVDGSLLFILNFLNDNHAIDILAWRLKQVKENGSFVKHECVQSRVPHHQILSGRDAIIFGYNPSSVCALAIRKKMIIDNDLFFKEGITHQDVELSYRLFANAEKVYFFNHVPYIYILHPNSTSQSNQNEKKLKYLKDEVYVIKSFRFLADKYKNDQMLFKVVYNRSQNTLLGLVLTMFHNKKEWRKKGWTTSLLDILEKEGLYPLKGPFDSFKKYMLSKYLNFKCVLR